MQQILRYIETARHLKLAQFAWWIIRRVLGRSYEMSRSGNYSRRSGVAFLRPIVPGSSVFGEDRFKFLNSEHSFPNGIDWNFQDASKLWRYNLHYFDYALQETCEFDWVIRVIEDWVRSNPPAGTDGWEPYPVSLRIVNWIKFALTRCPDLPANAAWVRSLYQQVAWVEHNLEYEIQANHLLKNVKALFFGGMFFAGSDADRWLAKGAKLLTGQTAEQLLPDGGHYERSPMYHGIVTEDLLDVLNLLKASRVEIPMVTITMIEQYVRLALRFIDEITYPDGNIPLFNNSAFGIAPLPAELLAYGARIFSYKRQELDDALRLVQFSDTGYYGYRKGNELLLIDAGPMGPSYQPGHGHCDLLSFELVLGGQRVVVDSGVFGYEAGELRQAARATSAHNTVMIDGVEQSDIWSSFRVGRRAHPIVVHCEISNAREFHFQASHDGYRHLNGHPVHERHFSCAPSRVWSIADHINGSGRHRIASYLHFHPGHTLLQDAGCWVVKSPQGLPLLRVTPQGGDMHERSSVYFPEFGLEVDNLLLCLEVEAELPAVVGYVIEAL